MWRGFFFRVPCRIRQGEPLPGIAVAIKDHSELGQTKSRVDGKFDLVVNGGGLLTINFTGPGHLPVQRTVDVPWQDHLSVDEVVMVPLDVQATAIDLAAGTTQIWPQAKKRRQPSDRHAASNACQSVRRYWYR